MPYCGAQVTSLFSGYVSALLAEHAANPSQNWKAKDCAMYLVVALAVRGRTAAAGVTSTNQLVNIQDFFNQQVAPCSPAMNSCPLVAKAVPSCVPLLRHEVTPDSLHIGAALLLHYSLRPS